MPSPPRTRDAPRGHQMTPPPHSHCTGTQAGPFHYTFTVPAGKRVFKWTWGQVPVTTNGGGGGRWMDGWRKPPRGGGGGRLYPGTPALWLCQRGLMEWGYLTLTERGGGGRFLPKGGGIGGGSGTQKSKSSPKQCVLW